MHTEIIYARLSFMTAVAQGRVSVEFDKVKDARLWRATLDLQEVKQVSRPSTTATLCFVLDGAVLAAARQAAPASPSHVALPCPSAPSATWRGVHTKAKRCMHAGLRRVVSH